MKLYAIIGAGGFGREVMPLAQTMLNQQLSHDNFKLVFVDDRKNEIVLNNNCAVMTTAEFLSSPIQEKFFNVAIADSATREKIAKDMIKQGAIPFAIHASNMMDLTHNEIGKGAILCPFTIITSNTQIGQFFHANLYSYVAHDCRIGNYVTFAPGVHCNGNVIIEDHVYVGTGVIIREGTSKKPMVIGQGAILGMGAVITKSVEPNQTVVGNPARPFARKTSLA